MKWCNYTANSAVGKPDAIHTPAKLYILPGCSSKH